MKHSARELRKHMTDAERLLWQCLRDRQLGGYKFRRQHPIGPFIVDFACLEKKIVIEIDGSQHINTKKADNKRSDYLNNHGFCVLRFWNNQVLQEKEAVLSMILTYLSSHDPPHPTRSAELTAEALSPRGEEAMGKDQPTLEKAGSWTRGEG